MFRGFRVRFRRLELEVEFGLRMNLKLNASTNLSVARSFVC